MCFGFLGIQFGFALQNANVSRIFQTLGAEVEDLPILWVAAPLTGLIVQPIIGYMSDRTWGRFGRRRPYFAIGAVLASLALFIMPNSPTLWIAAGMLWVMDASINVSMEPFRAFVGDMLPERQRTTGFAMQSFFIGIGAVVASALPWMMANWFEVSNTAAAGEIPESVKLSFYLGGAVFFAAVMWTVFRTKEYSPEELAAFDAARPPEHVMDDTTLRSAAKYRNGGIVWALVGVVAWYLIASNGLEKELYILAGGFIAFGLLQIVTSFLQTAGQTTNGLYEIMHDLFHMPVVMRRLAVVQFFSWFALFSMWIYGTSAVTSHHFGTTDVTSLAYNNGADWVGVLFAAYNGFAAIAAIAIPFVANRIGCRHAHLVNVVIGGLSLISFFFHPGPEAAAVANDRRRHRLGVYPVAALRAVVEQPAGTQDGRVHGDLQFLHRHPAAGRGERAGTGHRSRVRATEHLRHCYRRPFDDRIRVRDATRRQERRTTIKPGTVTVFLSLRE